MPITINGSGTITGLSVGGLPDGIVDTDMLAADAVTAPKIGAKIVVSSALIAHKKDSAAGSDGGALSAETWNDRTLDTEVFDPDGIVTISSNEFTLQAGTYQLRWAATCFDVNEGNTRIYNTSDSAIVENGLPFFARDGSDAACTAVGYCRVTIAGAKAFKLQMWCRTAQSGNGAGITSSDQVDVGAGNNDLYDWVEIHKEA